jgi:hypothetical protein
MRKTICTASIFLGMIAVLTFSILFQVPYFNWWDSADITAGHLKYVGPTEGIGVWFLINVLLPGSVLWLAGGACVLVWKFSAFICSRLRKSSSTQ